MHWTGTKWTSIKIPYGLQDLDGAPLAQDGRGGVWLSLDYLTKSAFPKQYLLHYLKGRWTRIPVPTTASYEMVGQVALAWIPGTCFLWEAVAEWNPKSAKRPGTLLKLKYAP